MRRINKPVNYLIICSHTMRLLILLVFLAPSWASWDDLTANIAVVEYQPLQNNTLSPEERVQQNALHYVDILKSQDHLDMIVFPEATLRTSTDTATEINPTDNPCDSTSYPQFVRDISCAARTSSTYTVINLVEKAKCAPNTQTRNCQNTGFSFHNTDVVFDRNGTIINRYRKYNLFGEYTLDQPESPDSVVIGTDFGINFGIFTCFDILFKRPAEDLLREHIDGVIFPTMWFSELPFLTAIQTQQMWAHTHNLTLFAAEANNPAVGSGGSGVYRGDRGAVVSDIVAEGGTEVLLYKSSNGSTARQSSKDVDQLAKSLDGFFLKTDPSAVDYKSAVLNASERHVVTDVCDGDFCCRFDVETALSSDSNSDFTSYTYLLVAFSGVRTFDGVYNGGIEVCGLVACLDASLSSCGRRFTDYGQVQWPLTFERIQINATFVDDGNRTQYPNSLLSSIRPIDASETTWSVNERVDGTERLLERTFATTKPQNRILTFAIYGRNFAADSPPSTNNSAQTLVFSVILISSALFHFIPNRI